LLIDFAAKVLVKMQSAAFSDGVARREKTKFTKKKYKTKTKLCTLVFCWLAIWYAKFVCLSAGPRSLLLFFSLAFWAQLICRQRISLEAS